MSSIQRAFAQKLSKHNAADVRRRATGPGSSQEVSWGSANTSIASSCTLLAVSDVPEPVDYEEFLQQHRDLYTNDPLGTVFQFPSDDIDVEIVPRTIRTEAPIIPESLPQDWSCQVRDSVQWLTRDFIAINYNYRKYSSSWGPLDSPAEREAFAATLPRHEFEIDSDVNAESACNGHKTTWDSASEAGSNDGRRSSWASLDLRRSESDRLDMGLLERIAADKVQSV